MSHKTRSEFPDVFEQAQQADLQKRQRAAFERLKTQEGFEDFLRKADQLVDSGVKKPHSADSQVLSEVMNFYMF